MKKILFILGTRPEVIKLAPIISLMKKESDFSVKVCSTGQHREMLDQMLSFFKIRPDFDLNVMSENQSLFDLTSRLLELLRNVLLAESPDLVVVQGDTTSAFVGALASFYLKIPVAHVEAGLRSFDKYSPFPEEINRVFVDRLSDLLFAPTEDAKENLLREGITKGIHVVGNTVIDALFLTLSLIDNNSMERKFGFLDSKKKWILVTAHRRENFGESLRNICLALKEIAKLHPEVEIIYPVHLNPNVRETVLSILGDEKNIHLLEPLSYPELVWVMNRSYFVLTDSGGIQEEAPSLGKPVLVMRDTTERPEGVKAGVAKLVGTNRESIVRNSCLLLENEDFYRKMAKSVSPYGDGKASERIVKIIREYLG